MNLGNIKEVRNPETGEIKLEGKFRTYSLDLDFTLEKASNRQSDRSPTHIVMGRGKHGKAFQAGSAWQGETKDGHRMFSLKLSIPEIWENEMDFVAFLAPDGSFDIKPSKPQEKQNLTQVAA